MVKGALAVLIGGNKMVGNKKRGNKKRGNKIDIKDRFRIIEIFLRLIEVNLQNYNFFKHSFFIQFSLHFFNLLFNTTPVPDDLNLKFF